MFWRRSLAGDGGESLRPALARRIGNVAISTELAGIFDRLGCRAESWQARLEKLGSSWLTLSPESRSQTPIF
jgi:hypothetical protein